MKRALVHFVLLYALLALTHAPMLDLPFHWDEAGQFVPQSLDLFERGLWIPKLVHPNSHPPGLMLYLTGWWSLTGYSIVSTRLAMLVFGALLLLGTWRLAEHLRAPGWLAALLLGVFPAFFMQSMMAQLDLPSAALCVWGVLWFVQGRNVACAIALAVATSLKETSLTVPAVLGLWLLYERRWRDMWVAMLPAIPVLAWLATLRIATGHWFGDPEYSQYNLLYTLHPVRLPVSILRRFFALFVDAGLCVNTAAILWKRREWWGSRDWMLLWSVAVAHTLGVAVLGGATLERYLLPAFPVIFVAAAQAMRGMRIVPAVAVACMIGAWLVYPVYPFSYENHRAMLDFVGLQQQVAARAEERMPGAVVAAAWPLSDGLRRPKLGYVDMPFTVSKLPDYRAVTLATWNWSDVDVLIVYPLVWEAGDWNVLRIPAIQRFLIDNYGYEPSLSENEIERITGFQKVDRVDQGPFKATIYVRTPAPIPDPDQ